MRLSLSIIKCDNTDYRACSIVTTPMAKKFKTSSIISSSAKTSGCDSMTDSMSLSSSNVLLVAPDFLSRMYLRNASLTSEFYYASCLKTMASFSAV